MKTTSVLFIVGTPLDENGSLAPEAIPILRDSKIVVGESRKVTFRFLKQAESLEGKEVFLLDPFRREILEDAKASLRALKKTGGQATLFSDTGMPLLFDPGQEVLQACRELGFSIRSAPAPTSWGSAMALSGFAPPFLLVGFLPRQTEDRNKRLLALKNEKAHLVLMDTPYRYRAVVAHLRLVLGDRREVFLAWEISKPTETLWWGTLGELETYSQRHGMEKGEFVIVIKSETNV